MATTNNNNVKCDNFDKMAANNNMMCDSQNNLVVSSSKLEDSWSNLRFQLKNERILFTSTLEAACDFDDLMTARKTIEENDLDWVTQQIATMEERLLEIWEDDPAQAMSSSVASDSEEDSELRLQLVEKDKIIKQLRAENRNLKEIIHADNIQHLERQMSGSTPSSEDEGPELFNNRYIPEQNDNSLVKQDRIQPRDKDKKPVDRETAWISNMVEVTSKLAKKYAIPAHKRPEAGFRRKGKRPAIVPKVFGAIWKLLLAPPKQIFVPDPRPIVNWMKVNTHAKRNLPKPEFLPVLGVSMNPTFYQTTKTMHMGIESEHNPAFERESPFGKLPGLRTSKGIMAMPEDVIHGYIWSHTEFSWVIAASPP